MCWLQFRRKSSNDTAGCGFGFEGKLAPVASMKERAKETSITRPRELGLEHSSNCISHTASGVKSYMWADHHSLTTSHAHPFLVCARKPLQDSSITHLSCTEVVFLCAIRSIIWS